MKKAEVTRRLDVIYLKGYRATVEKNGNVNEKPNVKMRKMTMFKPRTRMSDMSWELSKIYN